jgi:hypothetical protein
MMCINVPVTTILAANYRKKAIHESSKMCIFCFWSVKNRWREEGRVKLFCNLKLLTIPAYIS